MQKQSSVKYSKGCAVLKLSSKIVLFFVALSFCKTANLDAGGHSSQGRSHQEGHPSGGNSSAGYNYWNSARYVPAYSGSHTGGNDGDSEERRGHREHHEVPARIHFSGEGQFVSSVVRSPEDGHRWVFFGATLGVSTLVVCALAWMRSRWTRQGNDRR